MTTVKDIYDFIDTMAPFETAMNYDNVGILVGSGEQTVKKAIVSLDVSCDVIDEAVGEKADLIISHHPVIFKPLSSIAPYDFVYALARHGIAVISAHTNLVIAAGGVNDALIDRLDFKNVENLMVDGVPLGRVGYVEETTVENFSKMVKIVLASNVVRYVKGTRNCRKVAVVSGSGGDCVDAAIEVGADTLFTGEAKYNHFNYAFQRGLNLIEAGHYSTENVIVPVLCEKFSNKFREVEFKMSSSNIQIPFVI